MPRARPVDVFAAAPAQRAALDDAQRLAWLRLIRSENVGPVTFRELVNRYGGAAAALEALPDLARRGGLSRAIRVASRGDAEAELVAARRTGATLVAVGEAGYPAALAHVDVPPPLLYVKGDLAIASRPMVAIVGSRNGSAAGQKLARLMADGIGAAGYVIASGLARGIDGAAHETALARGTAAVVAGGIDVVYPPEHADLHARIAERGLLLSEQPPGMSPRGQDFPRRNRIISGISLGVVVVEAARRSGTLITARFAAEQGREVFAVPGHPLDPRAEGTLQLLRQGATLAARAEDVVEALAPLHERMGTEPAKSRLRDEAEEALSEPLPDVDRDARQVVLDALGVQPVGIDDIVRATGLPARIVAAALLELSLAGRIERHGAQLVSLMPA